MLVLRAAVTFLALVILPSVLCGKATKRSSRSDSGKLVATLCHYYSDGAMGCKECYEVARAHRSNHNSTLLPPCKSVQGIKRRNWSLEDGVLPKGLTIESNTTKRVTLASCAFYASNKTFTCVATRPMCEKNLTEIECPSNNTLSPSSSSSSWTSRYEGSITEGFRNVLSIQKTTSTTPSSTTTGTTTMTTTTLSAIHEETSSSAVTAEPQNASSTTAKRGAASTTSEVSSSPQTSTRKYFTFATSTATSKTTENATEAKNYTTTLSPSTERSVNVTESNSVETGSNQTSTTEATKLWPSSTTSLTTQLSTKKLREIPRDQSTSSSTSSSISTTSSTATSVGSSTTKRFTTKPSTTRAPTTISNFTLNTTAVHMANQTEFLENCTQTSCSIFSDQTTTPVSAVTSAQKNESLVYLNESLPHHNSVNQQTDLRSLLTLTTNSSAANESTLVTFIPEKTTTEPLVVNATTAPPLNRTVTIPVLEMTNSSSGSTTKSGLKILIIGDEAETPSPPTTTTAETTTGTGKTTEGAVPTENNSVYVPSIGRAFSPDRPHRKPHAARRMYRNF